MPPTRPSERPTTQPSFLRHRYNKDPPPFPLKIDLSISIPLPAWASLPTPPMSGTPPREPPTEPPQLAGRRRKREDTPPSTSQEAIRPASTVFNLSPLDEQAAQRYGEPPGAGRPSEQVGLPPPLSTPWEQPSGYGAGQGTAYALVTASLPPRPPPQVSPRATRKVKAHVASACVNCKRKHLRCDETRPCRRCVQSGKEETCRDVEHKKRGRPPLKNETEPTSSRMMSSGMSLPPLGASSGRHGPGPNLPPLLPQPTPARMSYPHPYAQPSIAQSTATAQGRFSSSHRPLSFPPMNRQAHMIPQCGPPPSGPTYGYATAGPPGVAYPGSEYPNPLFPRRPLVSQPYTNPAQGNYGPPPLQLPPILPAPPGTNIDPAIAQQQRHFQPQPEQHGRQASSRGAAPQLGGGTDERDPKRPKMDIRGILGPRE